MSNEHLDQVIQLATFAADHVVFARPFDEPDAAKVGAAVRAALEYVTELGLMTLADEQEFWSRMKHEGIPVSLDDARD